jgi:sugar lactone lactonase YvrE
LIAAVKLIDHDGDHTYSALTKHRGALFVGTLGRINDNFSGAVYQVSPDLSSVQQVAGGLHGVLGIAFDRRNRMYVLETTAAGVTPPFSDPTAGRLVRVERNGALTPIVKNLTFPSALIAGPDGDFYISNCGYHCDDRSAFPPTLTSLKAGQILKVRIDDGDADFESQSD